MSKVIWKYPLSFGANFLHIPHGAEILSVQSQYNQPFLWALVDTGKREEARELHFLTTGQSIYDEPDYAFAYINTIQLDGGALVFHIFERVLEEPELGDMPF